MKKVWLIIFTLCIVIISGCAVKDEYFKEEFIIDKSSTNDKIYTNNTDSKPEDIKYIRTDGYHESVIYPVSTVISSKQELIDYYNTYKDLYYFESRSSGNSEYKLGFVDAMEEYTDEYFNDNVLILVLLEETSGSIRHEVTDINTNESTLNIRIKRLIPEWGTDDMAEWHIFIGLSKADYVFTDVNVELYK